ncbi:TetR/AcrR family transcriptional regulator [Microbulbifer sp. EKSA005]|uniref:TetR/AcrR family transcriptional regulator n=1 Tax=Microbulbifer sp. EKSA005 TaxID=3243364 RepID=UPI004041BACA
MPYTKEHKEATRKRILESAFRLFTVKGFDGVTVNGVMKDCGLTRGAFYAHFNSKAVLYRESLKFAVNGTKLAELKPDGTTDKEWLCLLLDGYLSLEHVRGKYPCPLAFLATDIVMHDEETKATYANVYNGMNKAILEYARSYVDCSEDDILSVTAMLIGAVAIARTMRNENSVTKLLQACRQEAGLKLGGI